MLLYFNIHVGLAGWLWGEQEPYKRNKQTVPSQTVNNLLSHSIMLYIVLLARDIILGGWTKV